MSQDLESVMKNALDGKFFAFEHPISGGMKVLTKEVPKDYCPKYHFATQPVESSRRGGLNRAAQQARRVNAFWTEAKITELKRLHATGDSARKIGRLLGISRFLVGVKLNELGMLNRYGETYYVGKTD